VHTLLEKDGPYPALLVLIVIIAIASVGVLVRSLVNAKDEEIKRLVAERDRLQEMLGEIHPSSRKSK
jgi:hypothetical protein